MAKKSIQQTKTKKLKRLKRALRLRMQVRKNAGDRPRLSVHRSGKHIYAQVLTTDGAKVLASASTAGKKFGEEHGSGGNISAAKIIGAEIAEKAKAAGVTKVVFDRSGFIFRGRVKAVADTARENGLEF